MEESKILPGKVHRVYQGVPGCTKVHQGISGSTVQVLFRYDGDAFLCYLNQKPYWLLESEVKTKNKQAELSFLA